MVSVSACILILINLVVLLLGIAIAIFGALAQWGLTFFSETVIPFISQALKSTGIAGPEAQISFKEIAALMGQYINYLSAAGLVIFIFGLILVAMSFCGLCGACKKSKMLLIIYIILMVILLLAMVALTLAVRFARGDLEVEGRKQMEKYINQTFKGLNQKNSNPQSAILSLIQARLQCCGVSNGTDFDRASEWNRTYVFNNTVVSLKYPISCCKMQKGSYDVVDTNCFENPDDTNSNVHKGCYVKLLRMVDKYSSFIIYGLIGLDIFLVLLIILSVIIIRSVHDDD